MHKPQKSQNYRHGNFDKTDTLTKGEFESQTSWSSGKWSDKQLLAVATALEINSEHLSQKQLLRRLKRRLRTKSAKFQRN